MCEARLKWLLVLQAQRKEAGMLHAGCNNLIAWIHILLKWLSTPPVLQSQPWEAGNLHLGLAIITANKSKARLDMQGLECKTAQYPSCAAGRSPGRQETSIGTCSLHSHLQVRSSLAYTPPNRSPAHATVPSLELSTLDKANPDFTLRTLSPPPPRPKPPSRGRPKPPPPPSR